MKKIKKVKHVIIGAGVAGLSTAHRLLDQGEQPLIIDGGTFPQHKVCGEFFSPLCESHLRRWGALPEVTIDQMRFIIHSEKSQPQKSHHSFTSQSLFSPNISSTIPSTIPPYISSTIPLPFPARGMSRYDFDHSLLVKITERGGTVLTATRVMEISDNFIIQLDTGEVVNAEHLFLSTGRSLSLLKQSNLKPSHQCQMKPPAFKYLGIKGHLYLNELDLKNTLEMYLFPKAYLGFSPIGIDNQGRNCFNFACLADYELVKKYGGADSFINHLIEISPPLKERMKNSTKLFSQWLTAEVPEFGISTTNTKFDDFENLENFKNHKNFKQPNLFLIGDAAGTLPPATGGGLGMGVISGVLAADYALKGDTYGFHKHWDHIYRKKLRWGKALHWMMTHPKESRMLFKAGEIMPGLFSYVFSKIHVDSKN